MKAISLKKSSILSCLAIAVVVPSCGFAMQLGSSDTPNTPQSGPNPQGSVITPATNVRPTPPPFSTITLESGPVNSYDGSSNVYSMLYTQKKCPDGYTPSIKFTVTSVDDSHCDGKAIGSFYMNLGNPKHSGSSAIVDVGNRYAVYFTKYKFCPDQGGDSPKDGYAFDVHADYTLYCMPN